MSDTDLRGLERRWRETGSVEDEAAWLHARVQAGELEQSRLRLAAYLLHEGARLALVRPVPVLRKGQVAFLNSLFDMDKSQESGVRAVIAAARRVEKSPARSSLLGLDLAEQWCVAVDLEERYRLGEEALGFSGWEGNENASPEHRAAVFAALSTSAETKASLAIGSTKRYGAWHMRAVQSLSGALEAVLGPGRMRLSERPIPPILKEAIHGELVPWALGYSDPVRGRVEARQGAAPSE